MIPRSTAVRRRFAAAGPLWLALILAGCQPPQELPVVVAPSAESGRLVWSDPGGPMRGEVPWVVRTDLRGPDTYLVVPTAAGDVCAEEVSFVVLAGGRTEYRVTLVSDLAGRVRWRVGYAKDKKVRLFTCDPRPAEEPRRECLRGGVPRPLTGELAGGFAARTADGAWHEGLSELRFEHACPFPGRGA